MTYRGKLTFEEYMIPFIVKNAVSIKFLITENQINALLKKKKIISFSSLEC